MFCTDIVCEKILKTAALLKKQERITDKSGQDYYTNESRHKVDTIIK